jgi:hypothetical protein
VRVVPSLADTVTWDKVFWYAPPVGVVQVRIVGEAADPATQALQAAFQASEAQWPPFQPSLQSEVGVVRPDVLVCAGTLPAPEALERIRQWVRQGTVLWLFPPQGATEWLRAWSALLPLEEHGLFAPLGDRTTGMLATPLLAPHWVSPDAWTSLALVQVRHHMLGSLAGSTSLVTSTEGAPLLVSVPQGKGDILVAWLGPGEYWSDLALSPAFPVLVQAQTLALLPPASVGPRGDGGPFVAPGGDVSGCPRRGVPSGQRPPHRAQPSV